MIVFEVLMAKKMYEEKKLYHRMHEDVFIPAIAFMDSINGEMRQQLETYRTRVQEKDLVDIENVFFTEWKKQESNLQAFSLPSEAMEQSFAQYLGSTYWKCVQKVVDEREKHNATIPSTIPPTWTTFQPSVDILLGNPSKEELRKRSTAMAQLSLIDEQKIQALLLKRLQIKLEGVPDVLKESIDQNRKKCSKILCIGIA